MLMKNIKPIKRNSKLLSGLREQVWLVDLLIEIQGKWQKFCSIS